MKPENLSKLSVALATIIIMLGFLTLSYHMLTDQLFLVVLTFSPIILGMGFLTIQIVWQNRQHDKKTGNTKPAPEKKE